MKDIIKDFFEEYVADYYAIRNFYSADLNENTVVGVEDLLESVFPYFEREDLDGQNAIEGPVVKNVYLSFLKKIDTLQRVLEMVELEEEQLKRQALYFCNLAKNEKTLICVSLFVGYMFKYLSQIKEFSFLNELKMPFKIKEEDGGLSMTYISILDLFERYFKMAGLEKYYMVKIFYSDNSRADMGELNVIEKCEDGINFVVYRAILKDLNMLINKDEKIFFEKLIKKLKKNIKKS